MATQLTLVVALTIIAALLLARRAGSAPLVARSRARRATAVGVLATLALLSCNRDATAPDGGAMLVARGLSFAVTFPSIMNQAGSAASTLVAFTRVRLVLRHPDGSVARDTIVNFSSADAGQLTLSLNVTLLPQTTASGETLSLLLSYMNAAGDVVFIGGPQSVIVIPSRPGDPPPPPIQVPLRYAGPGANAASVRIAPRTLSLTAGDNFTLTAVALDATGGTLANTPMVWYSLDAAVATITSSGAGAGSALTARGPARICVQLLTGQADTVNLTVLPKLSALASVSGNGQVGSGGAVIAQPLVVRATATDGLPMAGVAVTFAPSAGGIVGAATMVTDNAGLAQTTWRLAPALGAQSLTAAAAGLAGTVSFSATSTSGPAAKLAFTTQPTSGTAGVPLQPVVVTVQDALGNTAASYTGAVTMTLGANPGGDALIGTATVNAVAGVATFPALRLRKAAAGYTLVASSTPLTGASSNTFNVSAAPATSLAVVSGGAQGGVAGSLLPELIVVVVKDSVGNLVAGTTVSFNVASGGGTTTPASSVTAGDGTASTKWTLGPTIGFQVLNVSGTGLTPNPLTVGASAAPLAQLQFVQQPTTTTAGVAMSPAVTVRAVNGAGVTDATFTGMISLAFQSNPSSATLAGTTAIAAVSGVATFSTLRVRKAGSGFSLLASASGWASATSGTFNIVPAPASSVVISSGNAQAGPTLTALTNPLVVLVTDSTGNPVSGVTVNWVTSNGSVSPASSTTNASGLASTSWTLGSTGGAQSVTASVGALSPVSFSATAAAPPGSYSKTWTGATNTDWSTSTNWNPAGVPSSTDSTLIPLVANQPVLSVRSPVGKTTIASGAVVNLGAFGLDFYGNLSNAGLITGTTGSGVSFQAWSPVTSLSFNGAITAQNIGFTGSTGVITSLSGDATLTGDVFAGSLVSANGHTLTVNGNMSVFLIMTNAADVVNVSGKVTFNAGDELGRLTAGTLVVGGDFQQSGSYQTFAATGTHKVVMKGAVPQHIAFYTSINRYSHFNDLVIDNVAGVVMDSVNYDNGSGSYYGGITEAARHLTILNGTLSGVRGGYLRIGGTFTDAVGGRLTVPKVYFDSSSTPVSGTTPVISVPNLYFDALVRSSLAGNLTLNGNVFIQAGDTLRLNGHALTVNGALTEPYGSNGALEMTNSADVLTVTGDMNLNGYPNAGTFTAGTMYAGGALNASLFQASGSHKLVMNGSGSFLLSIGSGDSTAVGKSRLNDLEIANSAASTYSLVSSGLYVNGTFTKTTTAATTLKWSGPSLEKLIVGAVNVTQPITFDRVQFWLVGGGAVTAFNNASFVNSWYYSAEDPVAGGTQQYHLVVSRGGAGSYTFNGLSFSNSTPQSPGPSPRSNPWAYVAVQGPAGLAVSLTGTSPTAAALPAGKTLVTGGASLIWTP
jgi:Bacterial Ig-like domain (group 1)